MSLRLNQNKNLSLRKIQFLPKRLSSPKKKNQSQNLKRKSQRLKLRKKSLNKNQSQFNNRFQGKLIWIILHLDKSQHKIQRNNLLLSLIIHSLSSKSHLRLFLTKRKLWFNHREKKSHQKKWNKNHLSNYQNLQLKTVKKKKKRN